MKESLISTVVIWNDDEISLLLLDHLKIWKSKIHISKDGEMKDGILNDGVVIITNYDDFEKLCKKQSYGFRKLFIMPEISWAKGPACSFQGYNLFRELLSMSDENDFSVVFCSVLDRKTLYTLSGFSKLIIKKFPHHFFKSKVFKNIVDTITISTQKLKFLKHLCFSSGFVDKLIHDLKYCQIYIENDKYQQNDKLVTFLEEIYSGSDFIIDDPEILKLVDEFKTTNLSFEGFEDFKQKISIKLDNLLIEFNNPEEVETNSLDGIRVFVIEDDPKTIAFIKQWLERHKAEVSIHLSGTIAFENHIKKSNFEDKYDVVLTDLELLDENKFDEDVQGIDIVEYCQKYKSFITLRVLTGMPKRTVSRYLNNASVIYKGNANSIISDNDSLEYILSIKQEVTAKRNLKSVAIMPKNGDPKHFINPIYNSHGLPLVPKIKENALRFHAENEESFQIKASLSYKPYIKGSIKKADVFETEEILSLFLVHRLIILIESFVVNSGGAFNYISLATNLKWTNNKSKEFPDLALQETPYSYLVTNLGFTLDDSKIKGVKVSEGDYLKGKGSFWIQISKQNWYPHEYEIIEMLNSIDEAEREEKYGF